MGSRILYDENSVPLVPSVAKAFGVEEAIVLQQVHFWLVTYASNGNPDHYFDDRWWVRNSRSQWIDDNFPWWTEAKLRRITDDLRDDGVLIATDEYGDSFDRSLWWSINYERLDEATKNVDSPASPRSAQPDLIDSTNGDVPTSCRNEQPHLSDDTSRAGQRGSSRAGQRGSSRRDRQGSNDAPGHNAVAHSENTTENNNRDHVDAAAPAHAPDDLPATIQHAFAESIGVDVTDQQAHRMTKRLYAAVPEADDEWLAEFVRDKLLDLSIDESEFSLRGYWGMVCEDAPERWENDQQLAAEKAVGRPEMTWDDVRGDGDSGDSSGDEKNGDSRTLVEKVAAGDADKSELFERENFE